MLSCKGDCAHVGAGGGTVVSSGGSSLASGKCSGKAEGCSIGRLDTLYDNYRL